MHSLNHALTGSGVAFAAAEIVTVRLNAGVDAAGLVAAANGLWTDHITWASMRTAKPAAKAIQQHPEAEPFMAMIDPGTATVTHAPIHPGQE